MEKTVVESNTLSEVDVNKWIIKYLNQSFKYFSNDEISVSEICGCLRKAYYARTRAQRLTPTEFLKILGNNIHQTLQEVLRSEGWDVEVSISIKLPDFVIYGRVDAVKDNVVLEFKTCNEIPHAPYTSHQLQIQTYLSMLNADLGYIIYLSRTNGKVKVFKVYQDKRVLKYMIERGKILYKALKERKPPQPENSNYCVFCEFTDLCFK